MSELPPPPLPPPPLPADRPLPGFWLALAFLPVFWLGSTLLALPWALTFQVLEKTNFGGPWLAAIQLAIAGTTNALIFAGLLVAGIAWSRRPVREMLPFRRPGVALLLALLPVALGMVILCSEADNLLQALLPAPAWLKKVMAGLSQQGLASFYLLVLVAPLTEELFFRGFVLTGFLKRYRPGTAIVLSSLLFGVFHVNPYQFCGAFALGLVMGWLRWRTGSLWPCLGLHALANGTVFAAGNLSALAVPGFTPAADGAHAFQPWWFDLLGLVLTALGLGLLALTVPRRTAVPPVALPG